MDKKLKVSFNGKINKKLEALLQLDGHIVNATLRYDFDYLITDGVSNHTQKVKKAAEYNIPVVDQEFIVKELGYTIKL